MKNKILRALKKNKITAHQTEGNTTARISQEELAELLAQYLEK